MTEEDIEAKLGPKSYASLLLVFERALSIAAEKTGLGKTCLSCQFFDETSDTCLRYQIRPPARVIVDSCPAHSYASV